MRKLISAIIFMFIFTNLICCKKKDMITPEQDIQTGKSTDTTHFFIENMGNSDKTFRIYGGETQLESVDDNSQPFLSTGTAFDSDVYTVKQQSDGKFLVGGFFSSYNGNTCSRLCRLNEDGSFDNTFNTGSGFTGILPFINDIAFQADGKIIAVGGLFSSYQGNSVNNIVRVNPDGSYDNTFVSGLGFNNNVTSVVIQPDGKILLGGIFTSYNGTSANKIIRLNSDGSVDATFVYGTGFNTTVNKIGLFSDGTILVAGNYSDYNGNAINSMVRLNSDGSLFSGFNTSFPASNIPCFEIGSDDKVIYTIIKGAPFTYTLAKINSNGTDDNSFSQGILSAPGTVFAIETLSDGSLIVGGEFISFNGIAYPRIAKLNSDGTLDAPFDPGAGFNGIVRALFYDGSDNFMLAGGSFTTYQGDTHNYITFFGETGGTTFEPVSIIVNGGQTSNFFVNQDSNFNPICISKLKIEASTQDAFGNLMYKKEKDAAGHIESEPVNLLSKFTANNSQNVVEFEGNEFESCVLDGANYLEWTIPAGQSVNIDLVYNQYNISNNLKTGTFKGQPKNKKKYVHAIIRY